MKNKILAFIGVAALGLATVSNLHAQTPTYSGPTTVVSSYVVSASSSSNLAAVIDVSRSQVASISIKPGLAGGSTNGTLSISASVDNSIYDTNHWTIGGLTGGTIVVTNITVGGFQSIRFDTLGNTNSVASTNTISVGLKISSP